MGHILSYGHFCLFFTVTLAYLMQAVSISFSFSENNLTGKQTIHVHPFGAGDFKSIQEAIDSVPCNSTKWTIIRIEPGIYKEQVIVPVNKPRIILSGKNANTTIITGDIGEGIVKSPIVSILASHFVGIHLTIKNTHKPGVPAVALRVAGDKVAFYSCKFLGYQDTLLDDNGRHYYKDCHIEGAADFICGNAASLYDKCHLHCIAPKPVSGVITAQKRQSRDENTGFYFTNCKITGDHKCLLGRPWGNYSKVVFSQTYMSNAVLPLGWNDWNKPFTHSTVYYGEHDCHGPGSNRSSRVPWSRNLTYDQALPLFWFLD